MTTMGDSVIIVLDTNVLLQAQPLDQIPWPKVVGADAVEIVLVSQVLRELDQKKNGDNARLKGRARKVSAQLNDWFPATDTVATIRDAVTLRVRPREPAPVAGFDFAIGDDRIVAAAMEVRAEATAVVAIVTNDTTLRFKAQGQGFSVLRVPEQYEIRDDESPKSQLAQRLAPRLRAGLFESDDSSPASDLAVRPGLSAKYLLAAAEDGLRESENKAAKVAREREKQRAFLEAQAKSPFGSPMARLGLPTDVLGRLDAFRIDAEPTIEQWEGYVRAIRQFDVKYANACSLVVGIANEGDAPADDVRVEFVFNGVHVTEYEPQPPSPPERRSSFGLGAAPTVIDPRLAIQAPAPNVRFGVDSADGCATMTVRRLMHSKSVTRCVWIDSRKPIGGFQIKARVLAASPPLHIDTELNVRFER